MSDVLERLWQVVKERRAADPSSSYVAGLHKAGLNKILEKVGEEATEVILAAKDHQTSDSSKDDEELIKEMADLWFHSMVLLDHLDATPDEVFAELDRRFGTSGITEKQSRQSEN